MSLYSYFAEASKRSDLPNPNGSLLASVSAITAIKEANKAVTRERASVEGVTLHAANEQFSHNFMQNKTS